MASETLRKKSKMPGSGNPDGGAVIGRHDHHHRSAGLLCAAAALGADLGGEMRGGDDDGHAAGDVIEHRPHDGFALVVAEDELLGEVGEDADAVRAGIDHEVDGALLPLEVEPPVLVEHGRGDRKHTAGSGVSDAVADMAVFSPFQS